MTVRYVGIGGSDASNGLSWANRKLTLNGAEDTPVVAGDTVYVGPGTYRENLTVDVSGTAGNPITYIGDYTGANTDGVGGLVRVTGSDNDQTTNRTNCITATAKAYRTFKGFQLDSCSANIVTFITSSDNMKIQDCVIFQTQGNHCINYAATPTNNLVDGCLLIPDSGGDCVKINAAATTTNSGNIVSNTIIWGGAAGVHVSRVGGVVVRNCLFVPKISDAVIVDIALAVGQVCTVNNCIFWGTNRAVNATTTAEFVEDYNDFYGNGTARTNVNVGTNSKAYLMMPDMRWFFQMLYGGAGPNAAKQVITPFDLSSFSQLINVAGTSPTTLDMRGTAVQGAQREYGPLEYDSTLAIIAGGIASRQLIVGQGAGRASSY